MNCGYTSAKIILEARAQGIDLVGPVKQAGGHQAHTTNGYAAGDFHIYWNTKTATCHAYTSTSTRPTAPPARPDIRGDAACLVVVVGLPTPQRLAPPPAPLGRALKLSGSCIAALRRLEAAYPGKWGLIRFPRSVCEPIRSLGRHVAASFAWMFR